jgi:Ca-activated chloride channel family protein
MRRRLLKRAPLEVTSLSGADAPSSIGIILDLSASITEADPKKLKATTEALLHFLEESNPGNEYFLMGFAKQPQVMVDWTTDRNAIGEAVKNLATLKSTGNTALFDACMSGIEKVSKGQHARHVLLLVSDGMDNDSHHNYKELRETLRKSDVLLYAVGLMSVDQGSALRLEGQAILDELTYISGGTVYFAP